MSGPTEITLPPVARPFRATVTPPGSKSLTNRALLLAAMARGQSTISNVLFADDTAVMLEGLRRLGVRLEVDESAQAVRLAGDGAIPAESAEIHCGNSGTTIRFLAALCTLGRGEYVLDGVERMRRRPIRELVDLLRNLGGRIEYLGEPGFAPLRIRGTGGLAGGLAHFGAAQSSQFLSAALHVAPRARREVQVELGRPQTSWPYVAMTMRLMDEFGAWCELTRDPRTGDPTQINVPAPVEYRPADYAVEPDASSATYFLAAAAINEGARVTVAGLGRGSLQGDARFADVLGRMGAYVKTGDAGITVEGTGTIDPIDADLADMPDTAQTLAVACLFADGVSTLRGLHTLRVKETDRLAALQAELTKFGAAARVEEEGTLTIEPPEHLRPPPPIDTYDDHRMAMSFAVASTRVNGVTIRDPACVNKTYPRFFDDFARVVSGEETA